VVPQSLPRKLSFLMTGLLMKVRMGSPLVRASTFCSKEHLNPSGANLFSWLRLYIVYTSSRAIDTHTHIPPCICHLDCVCVYNICLHFECGQEMVYFAVYPLSPLSHPVRGHCPHTQSLAETCTKLSRFNVCSK
jgi:hypothetical protein